MAGRARERVERSTARGDDDEDVVVGERFERRADELGEVLVGDRPLGDVDDGAAAVEVGPPVRPGRLRAGGAERSGEVQRRRRIGPRILEGRHGELHDGVGVPGPVEQWERHGDTVQVAVHRVGDAGDAPEDPAGERREHLVAWPVEPFRRWQPEAVGGGVAAGQRQREHAANDDGGTLGPRVAEHEAPPPNAGSVSTASAGSAAWAAITASYCGRDGVMKMCSMSNANALMPFTPARSGNRSARSSRSSKSASAGSAMCVAPVAATASAKRAPVMKRTRSPRATRCRATASSGVTWPWIGTLAMMIEDMWCSLAHPDSY